MPYQPDPAMPARYEDKDEQVPTNQLIPGVVVHRHTEPGTAAMGRGPITMHVVAGVAGANTGALLAMLTSSEVNIEPHTPHPVVPVHPGPGGGHG